MCNKCKECHGTGKVGDSPYGWQHSKEWQFCDCESGHIEKQKHHTQIEDLSRQLKESQESLDTYRDTLAKSIGKWKAIQPLIENSMVEVIKLDTIDGSDPSETIEALNRDIARFLEEANNLFSEHTSLLGCVQGNDYGTLRDIRQKLEQTLK